MKKWLPWIVTGFFAVWILSAPREAGKNFTFVNSERCPCF